MPLRVKQYLAHVRMFSPNAKLYLVATILQGAAFGIWGVIFNLYLRVIGFQPDFIKLHVHAQHDSYRFSGFTRRLNL
jgi:hypothetical protein